MENTELTLEYTLEHIVPASGEAAEVCKKRWDSIAKPLHSLGWMEEAVARIAAAQHSPRVSTAKKILVPLCADNGIVAEAVDTPRVEKRKFAYGTKNFAKEPAMTREEAVRAVETGIRLAAELKEQGYDMAATGEMGIGNTTTSSAVAASLLGVPAQEMTGRGAGLTSEGLKKKIKVISDAVARWNLYEQDPITVLSCVGGFDIAGMTGLYLGGALVHMPVLIDGFISSVAALLAVRICPDAKGYMLATHVSKEPAARRILDELGLSPALDAGMCLGEGSGAVAAFPLIEMAAEIYRTMSTFEQISIEAYQELS